MTVVVENEIYHQGQQGSLKEDDIGLSSQANLGPLSTFSLTFHKELSSSTGFAQPSPNLPLLKVSGWEKVLSLQA